MDKYDTALSQGKTKSGSEPESEPGPTSVSEPEPGSDPEPESELEKVEFAVLDLETTGLNVRDDEILSIAIIPMTGLRIHFGRSFYTLIKSDKIERKSIKLHGICPGDLEKAPTLEDLYSKICAMLSKRIIVGFNVDFDIAFLREKSRKLFRKAEKNLDLRHVDIKNVEIWILRRTGNPVPVSLDLPDLINKYGIEKLSRHNALGDAYLTARIFQKQMSILSKYRVTINELLQISGRYSIF